MDAILGATGLYDIGFYFPDSDMRWKDADSLVLLRHVLQISEIGKSFRLCNVDTILIAEKPRVSPFIDKIREKIAKELALPFSCVTVKVTTNEGMGPEGHEEGISAHAAVLVEVIRDSGNFGGHNLQEA
jgi:2-C-methyl-D-erythritol 2,4-cyclodiphosphate synthase